ncbi:Spy/CpxP family protein refolding chaperone [Legionella maceachernii]|nr:Spy/CpxP family protein refolding chaperone [Legionella maceachernii]
MMNKPILRIIIVAFSLIAGQVFAESQNQQQKPQDQQQTNKSCGCKEAKFKQMINSLHLSSDQQAKINAIKEQAKTTMQANHQQIKALRSQLNQLVESDNMDESKLDSLINQKKELMASMIKTKMMAKHQMYAVLNTQQKAQFQQMMHQMQMED